MPEDPKIMRKLHTSSAATTSVTYGLLALTGIASFALPGQLTVPVASAQAGPATIRLPGTVRDFSRSHPDFNVIPAGGYGHYAGNVERTLGPDGRPAFDEPGIQEGGGTEDIDLIAHWKFDEDGGTTAGDAVGDNHGTLMGGTKWVSGQTGEALEFDGSGDYVEMPNSPEMQITGDISFAGWFKLEKDFKATSPHTLVVMEKFLDVNHDFHIAMAGGNYNRPEVPKGSLVFKVENGPTSDYYCYVWTNTTSWDKDRWYHFACVLASDDTAQNRIFIDGVDDTDSTIAAGVGFLDTDYDAPMRIGGKTIDFNGYATDIYFEGAIDDVMIFRRVLTESDFTGTGGFKVDAQWEDRDGRPIAPHMYVPEGEDEVSAITLIQSAKIKGHTWVGVGGSPYNATDTQSSADITGTRSALSDVVPLPTLVEPADVAALPSEGNVTISSSTTLDQDMHADALTISGGTVTVDGHVRILVEGAVDLKGNDIDVLPGSHLELYFKGDFACEMDGNMTGFPGQLMIYNLGTSEMHFSNLDLQARILAPEAKLLATNAGHLYGSFSGADFELRNSFQFHADIAPFVWGAGGSGEPGYPGVFADLWFLLIQSSFVDSYDSRDGPYGGANVGEEAMVGTNSTAGGGGADACGEEIEDETGEAGVAGNGGIESDGTFNEWFRDKMGTNLSKNHTITLTDDGHGVYEYIDDAFHPIDGELLGNEGDDNNNYFTYSIATTFVYEQCGEQFLEFQGADDAWAFIGGQLVLDIGGVLPAYEQRIDLDRLGLADGERYTFHFFYAQRQDSLGSFRMRTNILFAEDSETVASGGWD